MPRAPAINRSVARTGCTASTTGAVHKISDDCAMKLFVECLRQLHGFTPLPQAWQSPRPTTYVLVYIDTLRQQSYRKQT